MLKVGIIGGGGYTAGELIRILQYHPEVEISFVQSASQAGKYVYDTHDDLMGECALKFTAELSTDVDALFLCMGHGQSPAFMAQNAIPDHVAVIDLGNDFRLDETWVYGLPELNRAAIQHSKRIANPGCFATTIQLGLLPLAKAGLLGPEVHINATTGSTGAGQAPSATTHFSWRASNLSVYKAFNHQHLDEIRRSLVQAQPGFGGELNFIPLRGDFTRGILATMYLDCKMSEPELNELYTQTYLNEPFTFVSAPNPHLKQVVNTNKCLVHVEKHGNKAFIISTIDNLTKGASGQAVQNLNLIFGLPEKTGLNLKSVAF
ncbi:N-acetyl-gamma-glutamyl-phosphate reductase [Haliscomenobacter hydrossis]|uniref:N-acetyl-gamma-glutamyl-phosphate reductase n=1 Tax=Haliscomenobacter hydrossis (strain ATCC 27775 / DSM 1100 / LMG 10767 / O) TaxID=760192 RepID=F4L5S8_HALH1|nr:N-acetyl-gamma-glutamyl-phosphate reductase [Haliscomenobacter hydrossis]AEE52038.1 N-acetyl-gamma-glutamyl-phosphate reductase [Haliscomenobacter hydrossis DSM 1100]